MEDLQQIIVNEHIDDLRREAERCGGRGGSRIAGRRPTAPTAPTASAGPGSRSGTG